MKVEHQFQKSWNFCETKTIHRPTFQCNHFASWIHDSRVSRDLSANRAGWIIHVNDDNLSCLSDFFPYTDKFVWLHGQGAESNICSIDSNACELVKDREKKMSSLKTVTKMPLSQITAILHVSLSYMLHPCSHFVSQRYWL